VCALGVFLRACRQERGKVVDLREVDLLELCHNGRVGYVTNACIVHERAELVAQWCEVECNYATSLASSESVEKAVANFTIGAGYKNCLHAAS
jgi:hypothetical protein